MGVSLSVLTNELTEKVSILAGRYSALQAENKSLRDENAALRSDLKSTQDELKKAQLDNSFLVLSHRLAQSPEALVESRKMIAALIRDIDRCIAQLKE
ncbi:MAG: hypothetical protein HDS74_06555 [Bacteroidales bacterium]|nr:hypothetical protein [Bacteroidales bacterium]MBD5212733.1 hypothetical protein [Bacteroidales bacterium]